MDERSSRRVFLVTSSLGGASLLLGCHKAPALPEESDNHVETTSAGDKKPAQPEEGEAEVTATEDLMREHGIIRRVLVVYREAASRLRTKPASVPADALQKATALLRNFGEDYHERKLEEAHLFPAVKRAGGPAAADVDVLVAQHERGRAITDYLLAVTGRGAIASGAAMPMAHALESFARMYEAHAAREDTIVFPAWKKTMSEKQLDEMGDLFEDIEHKTFGKDGFDDAAAKVADVERAFGIELAQLTAPMPPKG